MIARTIPKKFTKDSFSPNINAASAVVRIIIPVFKTGKTMAPSLLNSFKDINR